jgi:hypothetical protein
MEDKQRDEMLWKIAKKRASFKLSFSIYVFVNAFLIGVWYFSSGPHSYFWPIWPALDESKSRRVRRTLQKVLSRETDGMIQREHKLTRSQ